MINRVNIIGDIIGLSGYCRHVRGLANALNDIGLDVRLETRIPPGMPPHMLNDFEIRAVSKPFDPDCVSIMINLPPFWPLAIAKKSAAFYGFCVWEGDRTPIYWNEYFLDDRVDKVLVPSQHTKDAILKSCKEVENKIVIIPHGYESKYMYPEPKPRERFSFVANKGWNKGLKDRGGIQFLLTAFRAEFNKDEPVDLKIKLNMSYAMPGWNLDNELKKLELRNINECAPILITGDMIDDHGLRNFYNEGDVFISTSMSDAYNLPCAESLGCGLPVIATKFGGQSDYINEKNGWLIDKGEYGHFSDELMYEETQWFKPDIEEIRRVMRYVYEHPEEVAEKRKYVLDNSYHLTWQETAKKLKKLIDNEL